MHRYAWFFILGGLVILLIGLDVGALAHDFEIARARAAEPPDTGNLYVGSAISALILFVQTIGVTSIALGLFNIIIELEDWRNYFEERLRGVVTHSSYLGTLSLDELARIRNNVLKSHFKDPQIDREGGFLPYFDRHLYQYIGSPYREAMYADFSIQRTNDPDRWYVVYRLRYSCRKVCGSIQPFVTWKSEDEIELLSLQLDVIYPAGAINSGKRVNIAKLDKFTGPPIVCEFPLTNYKDLDGLVVESEVKYNIHKDKFNLWTVAIPTKGFNITVRYPENSTIQFEMLILEQDLISKIQDTQLLMVASASWILLESGLVYRVFDLVDNSKTSSDMQVEASLPLAQSTPNSN